MPNVRGKNQTLITCPLDADFLQEIDAARRFKSRSQFIREAIAEKLQSMGIAVPESVIHPPDRKGKGKPSQQVNIGTNHGTINVTQKKKSTSTSCARTQSGAVKSKG